MDPLSQTGAFGRLLVINAPETVRCTVCDGTADRLSSTYQGEGVAYHHYQCRSNGCPASGTLVEHETGDRRHVGPIFGDRDLAVQLATRARSEIPAEIEEARA